MKKPMVCLLIISFLLAATLNAYSRTEEIIHINFKGAVRSFIVYTPTSIIYPAQVVMTLHGKGGDAEIMFSKFGWDTLADAHGVMIVSPEGTIDAATHERAWNAGICCISGVDDVGFLGTVVQYIQSHYNVNPDRFFVWGYSNGGMMSLRMGCQSVWFKGIGDGEGSLGITFDQCAPSASWFHSHALGDTTVPFNGGPDIEGIVFPYSIPDIMTFWGDFYPVQLITINDCGHDWSCWSGITPPLFDQVWAFWQSHL